MGSKSKFVRCGFNGGTEQESGRQRHALKRCLASVIAVSLSIVCMVPAAYAQNIDDVSSSPNAVISGGGGNTVVAAPSARNVNVDDKTSEEANTSNGAPTPSETNQDAQQDSSPSSSTTGDSSESSNGATDNKADDSAEATAGNSANDGAQTRLQTMLLLKTPRTIPQMRRINRRRRPMCRLPRRRLAAVTLRVRSPRRSTARL